jgi:hypothetical protein
MVSEGRHGRQGCNRQRCLPPSEVAPRRLHVRPSAQRRPLLRSPAHTSTPDDMDARMGFMRLSARGAALFGDRS